MVEDSSSDQSLAAKFTQTSIYTGVLRKRGGGTSFMGRKSWKSRFFVLENGSLLYFESEVHYENKEGPLNDGYPYILPFCEVLSDEDFSGVGKQHFYFTIIPTDFRGGKGPLLLEAENETDRQQWLRRLNDAKASAGDVTNDKV